MKKLNHRNLFRLYLGAFFLLVVLPLNSVDELNNITILHLRGDYFFHIVMFLPWAFFRPVFKFSGWVWLLLGLMFAMGSEGIQYLLPYRTWNINDLIANSMGVVLGFVFFCTFAFAIRGNSG